LQIAGEQYGTSGEDETRRQNIQEVITAADDFEERAPEASLASFLDQTALIADQPVRAAACPTVSPSTAGTLSEMCQGSEVPSRP
jgi:superfamily I DNA/RNA helicase